MSDSIPPATLPDERSLWRTEAGRVPAREPRSRSVAVQQARALILLVGAVLMAFGAISAIAGRVALDADAAAHSASAWMWLGVVCLILGFAQLMVMLFLFAYGGPDRPSRERE